MKTIRPPALKKGDTIGVMAPSSRVDPALVARAKALLEARGYGVHVHPQTLAANRSSAGTPREKLDALHDLFRDRAIDAIICARGGNRVGIALPDIDYGLIAANPKIFMGYSDVTAPLNAMHKETGLVTFHGPMLRALTALPEKQLTQCFNLLGGKKAGMPLSGARIVNGGRAEGELAGGNLSLVASLMGTPWQPDFRGKILFLEDCNDQVSRYDRMLYQLRNAGAFREIRGLLLGDFSAAADTGNPFLFTLEDIVREITGGRDIPVVMDAPFGHGADLYTLPVGAPARLDAGGRPALKFTKPAVTL